MIEIRIPLIVTADGYWAAMGSMWLPDASEGDSAKPVHLRWVGFLREARPRNTRTRINRRHTQIRTGD